MKITFPWPPKELSPNRSIHWAALGRSKKKYKTDCMWICKAAKLPTKFKDRVFCAPQITFNPPDKRLRDMDNCVAAFKAGQDAMAEALGINDRIFLPNYEWGEPVKHGSVTIKFSQGELIP